MGVTGLLGLLKSIHTPCNLKAFSGQTIGVDVYGWLHRAAVSCAIELAQGRPTTKLVDFAMHRVRMLLHFGVTPYLVFDGDHLPSKSDVEKSRAERRQSSRAAGLELLRLGKVAQAYQELQKAVDITPEHARQLIEELKHNDIKYVVAPYEADAQLVYLERKGLIDGILSEDSDLLVFGAKCLLTKLDQHGECVMIRQQDFTACRDINLVGWSCSDFRRMAILSGCDYLDGIHKMGLRTAHRMVRKYKTIDRVIRGAQLEGKFHVPNGYLAGFIQAEWTFLYQFVYCPETQQLVHLTPPETDTQLAGLDYFGKSVESHIARLVASGDLHPGSKRPIIVESVYGHRNRTPIVRQSSSLAIGMKGKPIDQFFKPKRVPLAELNPNTFTPSPRQQQLLHHNTNRSWSATSILPNARPSSDTSQYDANETPAPRTAPPRVVSAIKRPRLCSDANEEAPKSAHRAPLGETSRFFGASTLNASSSLQRKPIVKRRKAAVINVWSDDSIEDAMAALPDLTSSATTSRSTTSSWETPAPVDGTSICPLRFATAEACLLPSNISVLNEPNPGVFSVDLLDRTRECELGQKCSLQQDDQTASDDVLFRALTTSPTPPQERRTPGAISSVHDRYLPEEFRILESPVNASQSKVPTPPELADLTGSPHHHDELPAAPTLANHPQRQRWSPKGSEDLLSFIPDSDANSEHHGEGVDVTSTFTAARHDERNDTDDEVENEPAPRLDLRKFAFAGAIG